MSTRNLTWQTVFILSYRKTKHDSHYTIFCLLYLLCACSLFELFIRLMLYYIMLPSNIKILRSNNNLPYSSVPQKLILRIDDTR